MKLIKLFEQFIVEASSNLSSAEKAFGAQGPQPQDKMRAIFLYNFTRYFEWPDYGDAYYKSLETPGLDSFTIYVVGNNPELVAELRSLTTGKLVGYSQLAIINSPAYDSKLWTQNYLKNDPQPAIPIPTDPPAIIYYCPGTAIVTNYQSLIVAETPGACTKGASINFQIVDDKLGFEYSQSAALAAGLETKTDFKPLATKLV